LLAAYTTGLRGVVVEEVVWRQSNIYWKPLASPSGLISTGGEPNRKRSAPVGVSYVEAAEVLKRIQNIKSRI